MQEVEYEYRPVRPFAQIPEKVLIYCFQLTPSSFSKVYLYLFNISYGFGKNKTAFHTSVRKIADILNISVGRTHNAISFFKKNKAIEKIESRAVLGTIFKVNLPEFSNSRKIWYFTEPEKLQYIMIKEKSLDDNKVLISKMKRYEKYEKTKIFDDLDFDK